MDYMKEVREKFEAESKLMRLTGVSYDYTRYEGADFYKSTETERAFVLYSSGYVDGYKDGTNEAKVDSK